MYSERRLGSGTLCLRPWPSSPSVGGGIERVGRPLRGGDVGTGGRLEGTAGRGGGELGGEVAGTGGRVLAGIGGGAFVGGGGGAVAGGGGGGAVAGGGGGAPIGGGGAVNVGGGGGAVNVDEGGGGGGGGENVGGGGGDENAAGGGDEIAGGGGGCTNSSSAAATGGGGGGGIFGRGDTRGSSVSDAGVCSSGTEGGARGGSERRIEDERGGEDVTGCKHDLVGQITLSWHKHPDLDIPSFLLSLTSN